MGDADHWEGEGVGEVRGDWQVAETQLSELQNTRVLFEEARLLAWNLAHHRRARLETSLGQALDEMDRQAETSYGLTEIRVFGTAGATFTNSPSNKPR
jgi:hypothetical protein